MDLAALLRAATKHRRGIALAAAAAAAATALLALRRRRLTNGSTKDDEDDEVAADGKALYRFARADFGALEFMPLHLDLTLDIAPERVRVLARQT